MKKLVLLVAGAMLIGISTLCAKTPPTVAAKLPDNLRKVITENLNYPNEIKNECIEGDVWLKICVTESSKINVIDISATNSDLGLYVKNELLDIYVENPGCKAGQVYFLKVKFDLLMDK